MYGLIGDPVEQSISHKTHNQLFKELGIASTYVKIAVPPETLGSFLAQARAAQFSESGFQGLSVTMPHKIAVMAHLDEIDEEAAVIGAVNTIVFRKGRLIGYNTDGKGALDAVETHTSVKGKTILLIGRGGAARAISYEAKKRGAEITSSAPFDILINATPSPLPIDPQIIEPRHYVMDINTLPRMTDLLKEAQKRSAHPLFGYEMFVNQAVGQFALWFPEVSQELTCLLLTKATLTAFAMN